MCLPLILIFTIIVISTYNVYYVYNREGYQSLEDCKKQGYPHDFCMRVPIQSFIN